MRGQLECWRMSCWLDSESTLVNLDKLVNLAPSVHALSLSYHAPHLPVMRFHYPGSALQSPPISSIWFAPAR